MGAKMRGLIRGGSSAWGYDNGACGMAEFEGAELAYFLGLDAGGTKTECWLGDERRVLAKAVCGTVKLTRVSPEVATERLRGLLAEVAARAGVPLGEVRRTCVGISGYSIAEVREWAAREVGERVGGEVEVCGDEEIALDAAFRGGPGILVIGGTGSIVVGRMADGAKDYGGGWGPGSGDEGSGFWIGREAVRAGVSGAGSGGADGVAGGDAGAWGAKDVGAVVGIANARPGPDFAGLVPAVVTLAEAGDPVARSLLVSAGQELAEQVLVVRDRMRKHGEDQPEVAFSGSILEKIAIAREAMLERLGDEVVVQLEAVNSMEGAMWRARRVSGDRR